MVNPSITSAQAALFKVRFMKSKRIKEKHLIWLWQGLLARNWTWGSWDLCDIDQIILFHMPRFLPLSKEGMG